MEIIEEMYKKLDSRGKKQFEKIIQETKEELEKVEVSDKDKEKVLLAIKKAGKFLEQLTHIKYY